MLKKIETGRDTIWMKKPASWWHDVYREGLVCGNGITGACIYGGSGNQTIMLSRHDLWHGGRDDELPDVHDALSDVRRRMDAGEWKEASWELTNRLKDKGYESTLEAPLPLADIHISIQPIGGFRGYRRAVQMDSAEVSSQWYGDKVLFRCDAFVSRAEDVVCFRIRASEPVIEVRFQADMHAQAGRELPSYCDHVVQSKCSICEDNQILYSAQAEDGSYYGVVLRISRTGRPEEGKLEKRYDQLRVQEGHEILAVMKTFAGALSREEGLCKAQEALDALCEPYEVMLERHKVQHFPLYDSARLTLGGHKGRCNEELLELAFEEKQPAELMEKLWKYGRYLFICGSTPESNPFPLYGLWCGDYEPMWPHHMANENTQMIYWHCFAGNLLSMHRCVFRYYNERIEQFRDNAKKLYGCRGIYMTAGTTPGVASPTQVVPVIMNWVGAAGWIASHYYKYMEYASAEDAEAGELEELFAFLSDTAEFYEDFITFYLDGKIKFYPSVSPENTPQNFMPPQDKQMAHPMPTTVNATIDLAIVKEFFTHMLLLAGQADRGEIRLGMEIAEERRVKWKQILTSIPPYKNNRLGAVKEWQEDIFEDRYDHRHLSHIYPVFPGEEINTVEHPEQAEAFKKAVALRRIEAQTGWSMAHMAAIYARFDEGEKAAQCLDYMAKACLLPNFFTLHNDYRGMGITLDMDPAPVQLDAIEGYVNALQEMLFFGSGTLLKLLPALPKRLKKGKAENFRFPGGSLSMQWDVRKNRFHAVLRAQRKGEYLLSLSDRFCGYVFESRGALVEAVEGKSGLYRLTFREAGAEAEVYTEERQKGKKC